jgi:hypothetical protein
LRGRRPGQAVCWLHLESKAGVSSAEDGLESYLEDIKVTAETGVVGKIVSRNNKIPEEEVGLGNVLCSAGQMIYKSTLRYISGLVHHCPRVIGTICLDKSPSFIVESNNMKQYIDETLPA